MDADELSSLFAVTAGGSGGAPAALLVIGIAVVGLLLILFLKATR